MESNRSDPIRVPQRCGRQIQTKNAFCPLHNRSEMFPSHRVRENTMRCSWSIALLQPISILVWVVRNRGRERPANYAGRNPRRWFEFAATERDRAVLRSCQQGKRHRAQSLNHRTQFQRKPTTLPRPLTNKTIRAEKPSGGGTPSRIIATSASSNTSSVCLPRRTYRVM